MSTMTLSAAARERTLFGELARFWAAMTAAPRDLPAGSAPMNLLRLNGGANSLDPGFLAHHVSME